MNFADAVAERLRDVWELDKPDMDEVRAAVRYCQQAQPMCKHGYLSAHTCKNTDHVDCAGCPGPRQAQPDTMVRNPPEGALIREVFNERADKAEAALKRVIELVDGIEAVSAKRYKGNVGKCFVDTREVRAAAKLHA